MIMYILASSYTRDILFGDKILVFSRAKNRTIFFRQRGLDMRERCTLPSQKSIYRAQRLQFHRLPFVAQK